MSSGASVNPHPQPAAAPQKSGSKVLLWVLGIIGGFILICIIAMVSCGYYVAHKIKQSGAMASKNPIYASAKIAAQFNPDVEIVSSDDDRGTLVIRDKRTGKTTSMKFDTKTNTMVITDDQGRTSSITTDTSSGSVSMQSQDGTVKLGGGADKAPSWVPQYPGATPQSTFSASDNEKQSGSYSFVSKDPVDKIVSYYADSLTTAGLTVSRANNSVGGHNTGVVTAQDKDSIRTVVVSADDESDGTHVSVTFEEKKH
jgi:hypothetical protein